MKFQVLPNHVDLIDSLKLSWSLRLANSRTSVFIAAAISIWLAASPLRAQLDAYSSGFNYLEREAIAETNDGAGFSFYAAVWPIHQQYPGAERFQLGLPSTWLRPFFVEEPADYYNTIEGGLGWWHDTRFATKTPKFIMGGVANNFVQWANGVGAGSSDIREDGFRDWNEPGGKYGVAQLSPNLLWPPDGLNMKQGSNGEFLGYGYHPLPITDVLQQTYGFDFSTGNQCWTLFLNTGNFKGPATFFVPTFWTETVLDDPTMEGLFFDARPSDKNPAFAMEYPGSPALIGNDSSGQFFARVLPLAFPKTAANRSDVIRDIRVYTKNAKWNAVESWFDNGPAATTEFQLTDSVNLLFDIEPLVDGQIGTDEGNPFESIIRYEFGNKIMNLDRTVAGFQWDTNVVNETNDQFILPEFYKLGQGDQWEAVAMSQVPTSTGLLDSGPPTTPRSDGIPYLTPIEPDCHLQDPQSAWNSPGPAAGPFTVTLGDNSRLTYYWYRFIDQPSIVHANLPVDMRQLMQERIEKIHSNWTPTDNYLPASTGGTLVDLDPGLIVNPPQGMEIGYVPIVTRQEKVNSLLGDVNGDGFVNLLDVAPFVELLSNGGYSVNADMNSDGVLNLLDVAPFVDAVSGG